MHPDDQAGADGQVSRSDVWWAWRGTVVRRCKTRLCAAPPCSSGSNPISCRRVRPRDPGRGADLERAGFCGGMLPPGSFLGRPRLEWAQQPSWKACPTGSMPCGRQPVRPASEQRSLPTGAEQRQCPAACRAAAGAPPRQTSTPLNMAGCARACSMQFRSGGSEIARPRAGRWAAGRRECRPLWTHRTRRPLGTDAHQSRTLAEAAAPGAPVCPEPQAVGARGLPPDPSPIEHGQGRAGMLDVQV